MFPMNQSDQVLPTLGLLWLVAEKEETSEIGQLLIVRECSSKEFFIAISLTVITNSTPYLKRFAKRILFLILSFSLGEQNSPLQTGCDELGITED